MGVGDRELTCGISPYTLTPQLTPSTPKRYIDLIDHDFAVHQIGRSYHEGFSEAFPGVAARA
jgi:hypothetical protein